STAPTASWATKSSAAAGSRPCSSRSRAMSSSTSWMRAEIFVRICASASSSWRRRWMGFESYFAEKRPLAPMVALRLRAGTVRGHTLSYAQHPPAEHTMLWLSDDGVHEAAHVQRHNRVRLPCRVGDELAHTVVRLERGELRPQRYSRVS